MIRRVRELTAEQKALISAVRRISKQRSRVHASYVAAILRAREKGLTYAAIANAAGTTSQAVQEIVRRHYKKPESRPGSFGVAGEVAVISDPDTVTDHRPSDPTL